MGYQVDENYLWVTKNAKELDKHPGKWAVIYQGRLIAVGDTLKDLEQRPEVKNAKHPLYHFVPEEGDVLYIF